MPNVPSKREEQNRSLIYLFTFTSSFKKAQSRHYYSHLTDEEIKAQILGDLYKVTKVYKMQLDYKTRFALLKIKFIFFLWY